MTSINFGGIIQRLLARVQIIFFGSRNHDTTCAGDFIGKNTPALCAV